METIKSKADISHIFDCGIRKHTSFVTVIICNHERHDHSGRVAFIAGKKLGNAVLRNRAKRRMRAAVYRINPSLQGFDLIFLAKPGIFSCSFSDLEHRLQKVLDSITT